ncbi:hypothetical protein TrST_g10733 [Triparma strigata]|uniref:Peptidase C45 hydrolase domain-containing protein n=1 Tax=Triparma strigata TaxID=1606541 RepID=A0A9W7BVR9_9STRA|nr:hypothetical protein TrST_g10733 [Triparma strigata]
MQFSNILVVLLIQFSLLSIESTSVLNRVATCDAETLHECGEQVGSQMRDLVQDYVSNNDVPKKLKAYIETDAGSRILGQYLDLHLARFPQYVSEVRGLAKGSRVPFSLLFALNLQSELLLHIDPTTSVTGCTDIQLPPLGFGHNEDNPPSNNTYLLHSHSPSSYLAFNYPGQLSGWAWSLNSHGICQSINALTSPSPYRIGIGVNFLARAMLDSPSLESAVKLSSTTENGGGQHFNLGQFSSLQYSIETSAITQTSVKPITSFPYMHANIYTHSDSNPIIGDVESSFHRHARYDILTSRRPLKTLEDILTILQDQHDPDGYYIRRGNTDVDPDVTHTTTIFDLIGEKVLVFVEGELGGVWGVEGGKVVKIEEDDLPKNSLSNSGFDAIGVQDDLPQVTTNWTEEYVLPSALLLLAITLLLSKGKVLCRPKTTASSQGYELIT